MQVCASPQPKVRDMASPKPVRHRTVAVLCGATACWCHDVVHASQPAHAGVLPNTHHARPAQTPPITHAHPHQRELHRIFPSHMGSRQRPMLGPCSSGRCAAADLLTALLVREEGEGWASCAVAGPIRQADLLDRGSSQTETAVSQAMPEPACELACLTEPNPESSQSVGSSRPVSPRPSQHHNQVDPPMGRTSQPLCFSLVRPSRPSYPLSFSFAYADTWVPPVGATP